MSLATFDEQVRGFVPPSNAMAQIVRMTELLDGTEPVHKTHMADCLTELAGRMKRREIVMIFSDFFTDLGPLEAALQRMRYQPPRGGPVPDHAPRRAGVRVRAA